MSKFAEYIGSLPRTEDFKFHSDSISFVNRNQKRFVILVDDLEPCLRSIWEAGAEIESVMGNDWSYEEGKFRQAFGPICDRLHPNSVSSNFGSQTPNTTRILILYAEFLLGLPATGALDSAAVLRRTSLDRVFSESGNRERFENWLREVRKRKEKSIRHYSGALVSKLSDLAGQQIFSIRDVGALNAVKALLAADPEFVRANEIGNGMYSAAISQYEQFLEWREVAAIPVPFDSIPDNFRKIPLMPSLLTKPFVILTGGSGTGKTKLAEAVATYYSDEEGTNVEVVSVGADWTDNRNVLGFVNHLREVEFGDGDALSKRPVYQSTAVVDLLLRAGERPAMPHFLILDEMNLSHVERYFADFLSAMEQAKGKLRLHDEGEGETDRLPRFAGDAVGVPARLDWPDNLFVIGTVNVDETTYMFSPKVLDRANVLEFKVDDTDIAAFLESPRGYPAFERAEPGQAEAFLQLAHRARRDPDAGGGLDALSGAAAEAVRSHLLALFRILQRGRFEFAYRTANEVMRYLRVSRHLATDKSAWDTDGWRTDVDAQILQKLLPKLHGSVGRIGPLLAELAEYCQSGTVTGEDRNRREHAALRLAEAELLNEANSVFSQSLRKLKAMIRALNEEQFVSFIQ